MSFLWYYYILKGCRAVCRIFLKRDDLILNNHLPREEYLMHHLKFKISKSIITVALSASLFCLPLSAWGDSTRQIKTEAEQVHLSTGVLYSAYQVIDNNNSQEVKVLSIDPTDQYTRMEIALANGKLLGNREKPTEMGQRLSAEGKSIVAATNGDFFSTVAPYYPIGVQISNSELVISPQGFPALGLTKDKQYIIGTPVLSAVASSANQGTSYPLAHVNRQRGQDTLVLYTPAMGSTTATNDYGTEVILKPNAKVLTAGNTYECVVTGATTDKGNNPIPTDSWVLSGNGRAQEFLQRFLLGDTIKITVSFTDNTWNNVIQAVGGHEVILENNQPTAVLNNKDSLVAGRHARTVAGLTRTGKLEVFVVGAQPEQGDGMTLPEMAEFLQSKGIVTALNLDGGGSSVMAIRNPGDNFITIMNNPSGGKERAVENGFLFFSTAPRGAIKCLYPTPQRVKLFQGSHVQFSLKALDEYYNPQIPVNIDWEVEPQIGSITTNGLFTGTGEGTGLVTIRTEKASTNAQVTVVNQIASLKISPANVQLKPGSSQKFVVTAYDENGEEILVDQELYQWTVDDKLGTLDPASGVLSVTGQMDNSQVKVRLGGKEAVAEINPNLQMTMAGKAVVGQQVTISVTHNNQPMSGATIRQVQPEITITTGLVNASALYIRSKPDTESSPIAKLPKGTELTVLSQNGDWYKVRLANGEEGYAFAIYLTLQGGGSVLGPLVQPEISTGLVNASALYIRSEPDTESSPIAKLPKGTELTVLSQNGDWCKVRLANGEEGYAFAIYLTLQSGGNILGQTDQNGMYSFEVKASGQFVFQAEKDNYLAATLPQTFTKK
jgi:exopolysaccharide biosynthesis protein/SH3-like domain-containing protein